MKIAFGNIKEKRKRIEGAEENIRTLKSIKITPHNVPMAGNVRDVTKTIFAERYVETVPDLTATGLPSFDQLRQSLRKSLLKRLIRERVFGI